MVDTVLTFSTPQGCAVYGSIYLGVWLPPHQPTTDPPDALVNPEGALHFPGATLLPVRCARLGWKASETEQPPKPEAAGAATGPAGGGEPPPEPHKP